MKETYPAPMAVSFLRIYSKLSSSFRGFFYHEADPAFELWYMEFDKQLKKIDVNLFAASFDVRNFYEENLSPEDAAKEYYDLLADSQTW